MGHKDASTKSYMKNPRKFADFFNGFMYGGKEVIDWKLLEEIDTTSIGIIPYTDDRRSLTIQRIRDIIKSAVVMKNNLAYFAILGIENQNDIHYAMPVRTMLYDALTYSEQVDTIMSQRKSENALDNTNYIAGITKDDKLKPVITVTLYWGDKPWDAPTTLKEMLAEMDDETSTLVNDFDINLFSIIDMVDIPEFKTELKELFSILKVRNSWDKMNDLVLNNKTFRILEKDTARIISDYTAIRMPRKDKDGKYNMCKAILEMETKNQEIGREQGIEQGIERGRKAELVSLVKDGLLQLEIAAKRAGMTTKEFERTMDK